MCKYPCANLAADSLSAMCCMTLFELSGSLPDLEFAGHGFCLLALIL